MPNTNDTSTAHVTLATSDLDRVIGAGGPGFPADAAGTALGMGISETYKQRGNIANAFNDAHAYLHDKGWQGINAVKNGVSNFFNPPTPGPSTYVPATANPDGSVNPGRTVPQ